MFIDERDMVRYIRLPLKLSAELAWPFMGEGRRSRRGTPVESGIRRNVNIMLCIVSDDNCIYERPTPFHIHKLYEGTKGSKD